MVDPVKAAYKRQHYLKNRAKYLARAAARRLVQDPQAVSSYQAEYRRRKSAQVKASTRQWQLANPERYRIAKRRWQKNNAGSVNAKTKKYKCQKIHRTPTWLTEEQLADMRETYILAKELRWLSLDPLEVDHIVPLNGADVSGLHVPWNLQIIPKSENARKRNKHG